MIWLHLVNYQSVRVLLAQNEMTAANFARAAAPYKSTNCLNTSHFKYVEQGSVHEHNSVKFTVEQVVPEYVPPISASLQL